MRAGGRGPCGRTAALLLLMACGGGPAKAPGDSAAAPDPCVGEAAPETIEAAVDHLRALQGAAGTVDGPCLVRSLARPLVLVANSSVVSAQPAQGAERPRLFLQSGPLTFSLVPVGLGAGLLEFGERDGETHTRKGEVELPIVAPPADDAPFARIRHPDHGTTCAVCHQDQRDHPVQGTVSEAIRPEPWTDVPIDELRQTTRRCTGEGCALLEAIFEGEVEAGSFPAAWPTVRDLAR